MPGDSLRFDLQGSLDNSLKLDREQAESPLRKYESDIGVNYESTLGGTR